MAPAFGMNYVPRQTEPPLDEESPADRAARMAGSASQDDEPAVAKSGLLTRFIGGAGKEAAERKPLPVSARTSAESGDDLDF
jgi:hypothetical protein